MKLRYGDLLQLLERMHALPTSRRTATESRLKNFSRIDFPNGPRVGSGERAEYGVEQVIQLLFAFELLRLRMPPAVIAEIVRTEWMTIGATFARSAKTTEDDFRAASNKDRPMLVIDAVALHEAGKTVRRGELLSTIEVVAACDLFGMMGDRRRSVMAVDPTAILADAVALVPALRRSIDATVFLTDVAGMGGAAAASDANPAAEGWEESGYGMRRALADALAVLRDTPPLADGDSIRVGSAVVRRLNSAMAADGKPLSLIIVDEWRLDAALAVYLHWIEAVADAPLPKPGAADTLAITTRAGSPRQLHEKMVDVILREISTPTQDN